MMQLASSLKELQDGFELYYLPERKTVGFSLIGTPVLLCRLSDEDSAVVVSQTQPGVSGAVRQGKTKIILKTKDVMGLSLAPPTRIRFKGIIRCYKNQVAGRGKAEYFAERIEPMNPGETT